MNRVIVVAGEGWHHGVVGIAAARLVERYGRPVIMLSSDREFATGSGRSIAGFNLYEAIAACKDLLTKFGGHTLAAGMTLPCDAVEAFREKINAYAKENYPEMPFPELKLDCKLNPAGINIDLADSVGALAPFGHGNPTPVFGLFGLKIENIQPLGGGKHIRVFLSKNGAVIRTVQFGMSPEAFPFDKGDTVDIAVQLEKNIWQGDVYLSIQIKDIRPSFVNDAFFSSIRLYERFRSGEVLDDYSGLLIDRADAAVVFRFVRGERDGAATAKVINKLCGELEFAKVMTAIDVLCELSVLHRADDRIRLGDASVKVDLSTSEILNQINLRMKGSI